MRNLLAVIAGSAIMLGNIVGAAAQDSVSEAIIAKAQSTLVVVNCPKPDDPSSDKLDTGIIVSSSTQRSYIVTAGNPDCRRTVYVNGDLAKGYPARSIGFIATGLATDFLLFHLPFELIAIDQGGLTAATLDPGDPSNPVFVLSFTQSGGCKVSTDKLQSRLNDAILSDSSAPPNLMAIRGISLGGGVFDLRSGDLAGVITFVDNQFSLGVGSVITSDDDYLQNLRLHETTNPRIGYSVSFAQDILFLAWHSSELVPLTQQVRPLR